MVRDLFDGAEARRLMSRVAVVFAKCPGCGALDGAAGFLVPLSCEQFKQSRSFPGCPLGRWRRRGRLAPVPRSRRGRR